MEKLPSLRYDNPFTAFRNMFDEFINEPFFMGNKSIAGNFTPRVDITEDKERYLVRADLPGINKDDINVTIEGDTLTISGEKREERKKEEGTYSHLERIYGSFQRSFKLPEYVDKEKVDASYRNGVLELSLLKAGETKKKAKQIEIKS